MIYWFITDWYTFYTAKDKNISCHRISFTHAGYNKQYLGGIRVTFWINNVINHKLCFSTKKYFTRTSILEPVCIPRIAITSWRSCDFVIVLSGPGCLICIDFRYIITSEWKSTRGLSTTTKSLSNIVTADGQVVWEQFNYLVFLT